MFQVCFYVLKKNPHALGFSDLESFHYQRLAFGNSHQLDCAFIA